MFYTLNKLVLCTYFFGFLPFGYFLVRALAANACNIYNISTFAPPKLRDISASGAWAGFARVQL